ncbi:hypothetical protein AbraIFM66950_001317 [Aspergillus brasiliensis]|nr:hypothetical protein AbraIFM66950_001317 [Aspergillus brasiliensis]
MKYPWLRPLKAKALQQIAQKTGIQSSGTKAVLVERLECELAPLVPLPLPFHAGAGEKTTTNKKDEKRRETGDDGIRVLSIDMGIRNLAFAVLHSPHSSSSPSTPLSGTSNTLHTEEKECNGRDNISLIAWKRLSIPDLCRAQQHHNHHQDEDEDPSLTTITPAKTKTKSKEPKEPKEDFSPSLYARHAYTLITTLLSTYNPTHILIERQRFRTGGGSAVQEWTIRVGVLEGMLYAVLETINSFPPSSASSLLSSSGGSKVQVYPVEPGRVSRFWGEGLGMEGNGDGDGDVVKKERKKRKNVRDVKKMKIGLVKGWLLSAVGDGDRNGRVVLGGSTGGEGEGDEVKKLASAFLEKCEGKRRTKKDEDDSMNIGKLDDLADCLVQGVTWLEWQRMREKIVREGGINA